MKLLIGDKSVSSWSMRPWLLLTHFAIPFDEIAVRLGRPDSKEQILRYSPSGKVPCLITDAGEPVWESLAIIETLAEQYPQHAMWPRDASARARARSISAEMHAGFADLRSDMPMDVKKRAPGTGHTPEALANVARIEAIWQACLSAHGGPFLFGEFGIADAMFAPVVMRFNSYAPPLSDVARAYAERVTALPAVAAWIDAAGSEQ
ncbi:glutathione S-transferase family protein [Caballeronia telluris]|uniref:Glutathione S-transferase domain-containing protein n=1 Tax=Caballeronia telluris TaxID=326475 RepID=A0A158J3X8_9BURK|nr:glutathione S-transferase family protein [Caballeronia telluris]SAL63557.1 glutathione S-transferase domain-containing protein [Caballeronia telluris]